MTPQQERTAMDWEGRPLLDRDGDKIGTIEEIYLVEETGQPEWALVKLGRLGGRATLVPLAGADPVAEGIRAAYPKSVVTDAPRIDPGDEPSEQEVAAVYRHYGMESGDGSNGHGEPRHDDGSGSANGVVPPGREAAGAPMAGSSDKRDEPVADLLRQVSDEASTLVRQEIRLATAEMSEKVKEAGVG
ncbi:MAG TPA: PRC-barrel domain-containing protein, partial [Solirubrobacteraceae bacterium]|nr:PRC-barrel domain-containing protein [Solirubrobacteraceae bacterium]